MILADQHMHTLFSPDGCDTLAAMAQRARQLGLAHICFTEHMDSDTPDGPELWPEVDTEAYRDEFLAVQYAHEGALSMGWGIEYGMQPHLVQQGEAYLAQNPFDFVIASCHVAGGQDPASRAFYRGRTVQAAYRSYFEDLARCVELFDNYDVCGHIDYVVRYGPDKDADYTYEAFADVIDPILYMLIRKGKGVEINTAGLRYGLRETNPCAAILRRYRQLGGEIVTVGSDAHNTRDIAADFDRARQVLLDCGFTRYAVFRQRRPEFRTL